MADFSNFVDDYYRRFVEVLSTFDRAPMQGVLDTLVRVQKSGGTVWIAGNGGSAAIADHTVCDTTKGTYVEGQPPLRTISLNSNVAMLTALSNDLSYEHRRPQLCVQSPWHEWTRWCARGCLEAFRGLRVRRDDDRRSCRGSSRAGCV
jgi:hypothetical protein